MMRKHTIFQTKPKIYVFKYEKSKPGFAIFSQALFLSVWGFVFSGACRMCLESVFRKRMRTSAWICVCLQLNAFVISVCTFYFHKIHKISVIILHRIQHSFHFGTVSLFVKCEQCSPIDIYILYIQSYTHSLSKNLIDNYARYTLDYHSFFWLFFPSLHSHTRRHFHIRSRLFRFSFIW